MNAFLALIPKSLLAGLVLVLFGLLGGQTFLTMRANSKLAEVRATLADERAVAAQAAASAIEQLAQERRRAEKQVAAGQEVYRDRLADIQNLARDSQLALDRMRDALAKARARGDQAGTAAAAAAASASRAALETVALQCSERYRGLDEVARRIHATAERCAAQYDAYAHALNGGSDQPGVSSPAGSGPLSNP